MAHAADPVRNIRLLQLYWFLSQFQLWIPVWIVYLTLQRGFSLTEVTGAEGLFLVGAVLLEVPTGAFADRYGRSRSLTIGALCFSASVLIFAVATSFPVLLASFILWSFATTFMNGADMALLFDTLRVAGREEEYEHLSGRGNALMWAGVLAATLLGGPVAALTDIRFTIFAGAATCLLTALVASIIADPPHERAAAGRPPIRSLIRLAFGELWHQKDVRAIVLLAGVTSAAFEAAGYLVQPYLVDRDIEVGTLFSLLQVPIFLGGCAGALFAARTAARFGPVRALVVGPLFGIVAFVALAAAPGLGAIAAFPVIIGLATAIRPIATGYVNRRVSSEARATILSMQSMVIAMVLAVFAPAIGFITDHWGLGAAFSVGAGLAALAVLSFGPQLITRSKSLPLPLIETEV